MKIEEDKKKFFAGIYLLDYMINAPKKFSLYLEDRDSDLEPVLEWLLVKKYVHTEKSGFYIPTSKGRNTLKEFMGRYTEYLKLFDVYCAVDLEEGVFAFSEADRFGSDITSWKNFLAEERWDDLRVAVAEFKKMDPVEIVFMSFLNEGRFGRDKDGWQFDLLLGTVWDDILKITESAIHMEELGFEDEEGMVPAEDVIADIVSQGTEIALEILKEEDPSEDNSGFSNTYDESDDFDSEPVYRERIEITEEYYDPCYVSPRWRRSWW